MKRKMMLMVGLYVVCAAGMALAVADWVFIDNGDETVAYTMTQVDVTGTMSGMVGNMAWTNDLTGAHGSFPAQSPWSVNDVALDVGTNTITVSGENSSAAPYSDSVTITRLPAFSDIEAGFFPVGECRVAWGDYDNDGDLDVLVAGENTNGVSATRIYGNDTSTGGGFADIAAGLPGVGDHYYSGAAVAWGDYDNDSDLDIVLCGRDSSDARISRIYRNDMSTGGGFTNINAGLTGVQDGSVA